jgi:16S rRNA (guanine527-N7)-methyltransferase
MSRGRVCQAGPREVFYVKHSVAVANDAQVSLERLRERYGLSDEQLAQLWKILAALESDELAPTSVRERARAVDVHLADSLVALELERGGVSGRIVEIGAGAGFPGLPLAVALPASRVTLVESLARKCAFLERLVAGAEIENAAVVCARVEEWPEGIGAHDLALARAVAAQPVVLEYAAPLLRLGGALVDWRGRRDPSEEQAALAAAERLGLERDSIRRTEPFDGVRDHNLHVYVKVAETPDEFPRRAGTASRKPLAKGAPPSGGDRR